MQKMPRYEIEAALAGPIAVITVQDASAPNFVWQILEVGDITSALAAYMDARAADGYRYDTMAAFFRSKKHAPAFSSTIRASKALRPEYQKHSNEKLSVISRVRLTLKGSDEEKLVTYKSIRKAAFKSEVDRDSAIREYHRLERAKIDAEVRQREIDRHTSYERLLQAAEEEVRAQFPALADLLFNNPFSPLVGPGVMRVGGGPMNTFFFPPFGLS